MKQILFITNYKPGTGGISGQVEILRTKLCQDGYVADIFSTKGSILYRLGMMFRLLLVGRHYDVFHIHCCSGWGFLPAVVGVLAGHIQRKRIVLTYHGGGAGTFFSNHRRVVSFFLKRTDVNIVLSGFIGDIFDKCRLPYTIIPNIIEMASSHYRERKVLSPKFICTRSLEPLYNHACILKAFQLVQVQLPEASLALVGGGSIQVELEKMVKDLRLNQVSFVGRVDNSEVYKYLDQADIMLSAPHIDNMPVSILEGINAGLLVISSRVGGVPYMVEDHKSALLFDDDDYHTLSKLMMEAVANPVSTMLQIRNARSGLSKYTWEQVRPLLLKQYGDTELCR